MKKCGLKTTVTLEEKSKILDEAKLDGVSLSEYVRSKLRRHSKSELTEIQYLLKKISNNVNQTAKALNIANLTARIEPKLYEMAFASTYNLQKLFHKIVDEFAKIK